MKTNKEILSKIRERAEEENKKISGLISVINQLEGRDEPEKTDKAKMECIRHFAVWSELLDLYHFANED